MSSDAISTVGGLWSAQILDALRDDPTRLSDTDPADYRLPPRYPLRDATRQSWGLLAAAWADFDRLHQARVDADGEHYGSDLFTIERWLTHLWTQLGYSDAQPCPVGLIVDGGDEHDPADRYPIGLLWRDRVPIIQVPAGTPLDRVTAAATGGARRSPHAAMQDYLNRTSRHLWGIVTNGLTLRLLRNNAALTRQAYVEFDLAEIFRDDNYPAFATLWLALHSTRFDGPKATDCPAERWQHHALDVGVRALNTLRQGVENAILTLGQGLIEHPRNQALRDALTDGEIDGQGLYRELLYVAYRHVFLFAVEDRGVLHPDDTDPDAVARYRANYSTARLREQARRHTGGQHPDGWAAFQTLTRILADPEGQPLLGLPPLMGALWDADSTPHLNDTVLTNRHYYEAVRSLAFVRQDGLTHRIDYRNLGAEELGSVYESLLELIIDVSPTERRFTKRVAAGSDRKTTGSYYTPTSLITRVLQDALDPVIERAVKGLDGDDAAEALLDLTVCDPAMGSGHFLVAAAHRLAKQVATHRTGSLEPDPAEYRQALRDVTSRCIYGVDINPMAVELAKISLWIECHVAGQPLTFLDHHLKCGNALLGVGFDRDLIAWAPRRADGTPEAGGVPDAAFKAIAGDDKKLVKTLKAANKQRRAGVASLLASGGMHDEPTSELADRVRHIAWMDDTTPQGLAAKQRAWMIYGETDELHREKLRADAWTACWTIPKTRTAIDDDDRPFDVYYDAHFNGLPTDTRPGVRSARQEAERLRFFHWYLEFPEIAESGGFSCLAMNPPWERIKLQEKEWFAANGYEHIGSAKNAASRKRLIGELGTSEDPVDRAIAVRWAVDSHAAQAMSEFARNSDRYPFGGVGDVNLYALFVDHAVQSIESRGRVGVIVPTGLVTDYTFRNFFAHLIDERRLAAAYDFTNKRGLFPEVAPPMRFVTLTVTAPGGAREARFAFMVEDPAELDEPERSYSLTPDQIALVNPNTKTAPVFLDPRDSEITTRIYQRHPVLIHHGRADGNPWGIKFSTMFHMANDSGLFRTADQLSADGWSLIGNIYERDGERMLPLYEAKLFRHFDADHNTYEGVPESRKFNVKAGVHRTDRAAQKVMQPRYWVAEQQVHEALVNKWGEVGPYLAWRDITNVTTNQRTTITAMLPAFAANDKCLLARTGSLRDDLLVLACWASFAFDYVARQKVGGTHMMYFLMEQLPVLAPQVFEEPLPWGKEEAVGSWVAARSAALSATSPALATSLGYATAPSWDDRLREVWRTELDAAMFHLYGYSRDEVAYVMDTFPIVAENDRKAEDLAADDPNWRTKRLILAKYDELAEHARRGTTYASPDPPPPLPDKLKVQQA